MAVTGHVGVQGHWLESGLIKRVCTLHNNKLPLAPAKGMRLAGSTGAADAAGILNSQAANRALRLHSCVC